jgi:hypothetical protein
MEADSPHSLHTVVLMRLVDEASKEGLARALSRLGGLPVERVLQRLESLPWTLIRDASRAKALRLVTLLEDFKVEIVVVPALVASDAPPTAETAGPGHVPSDVGDVERSGGGSGYPRVPSTAAMEPQKEPPAQAEPPQVTRSRQRDRSIGDTPPEQRTTTRLLGMEIEPLALEGVLDPAFRIERPDSWVVALVSVPWHVLSGTLRALAGTLDRSFELCRVHFWRLFAIGAIPWIIVAGIALIGILAAHFLGITLQTLWELPLWTLVVGTVVLVPASVVAGALLLFLPQAALIHAISETYLGRDIPIAQAYRFAWTKLVRFVLTYYLMMLAAFGLVIASTIAAGLLAVPLVVALAWTGSWQSPGWILVIALIATVVFVLPLAYCLPKLLLFDKVVIIEDLAYADALKRSWNMLSGRAGAAWYTSYYWLFGMLLLVLIPLQWAIYFLFEGPALLLIYLLPGPKVVGTYAGQVLSTFGSLLTHLYVAAVMVSFYYCVRGRREGHDLMALVQTDSETGQH